MVEAHFDPAPPSGSITLQAENALYGGQAFKSSDPEYHGTGFLDFQTATGSFIEWTVNTVSAGTFDLAFRYALPSGDRPLSLSINGAVAVASLSFPATGSWSTWVSKVTTQTLASGANKVRITTIGSSGGNFDELVVTGAGLAKAGVTPEVFWKGADYLGLKDKVCRLSRNPFLSIGLAGNVDDNGRLEFQVMTLDGKVVESFSRPISGMAEYRWDVGGNSKVKPGLHYYRLAITGLNPKRKGGNLLVLK